MKKLSFMKKLIMMLIATILLVVVSCDENELPGVGDLPDENPPVAGFAALVSGESYLQYSIINSSISATTYQWTVPDNVLLLPNSIGSPTREELLTMENLVVVFPEVNTYEFTLSASDDNDVKDVITQTVAVVEQEADPAIPDFEVVDDGTDPLLKSLNSAAPLSSNTSTVEWVLPDGVSYVQGDKNTEDITVQFDAFGTYTIGLIGYNFIGEGTTIEKEVVIADFVPDPIVINGEFSRDNEANSSSFGWKNGDIGQYTESSNSPYGGGDDYTLKFQKLQAMTAYQEIEVVADTDYVVDFEYAIKEVPSSGSGGAFEFRVLKGGAYDSLTDVEDTANNVVDVSYFSNTTGLGSKDFQLILQKLY